MKVADKFSAATVVGIATEVEAARDAASISDLSMRP